MRQQVRFARHQSGLSYVEVLVSVIIIAVTVMPATDALRGAMHAAETDTAATVNHYRLLQKLEDVLADPFAIVSAQAAGPATPSTYSDAGGSADRRVVFINLYDGDNADADNDPFTGTDSDLLWVRVEIEGTVNEIQALKRNE